MNKTEMKKIFSKLSNIQQKVLIKALRRISIEIFNYLLYPYGLTEDTAIDKFNKNLRYDGYVDYINTKVVSSNGKKFQRVHYIKDNHAIYWKNIPIIVKMTYI